MPFHDVSVRKLTVCRIDGDDGVEIHPAHSTAGKGFLASLQSLLQVVPDVIVQGIPTVERAVISKDEKDNNRSAATVYLLGTLLWCNMCCS